MGAEFQSGTDAEMAAVLARAAKIIRLALSTPPCLDCSRLDDWFVGAGHNVKPPLASVSFFLEVYEMTISWEALSKKKKNCQGMIYHFLHPHHP